MMLPSLDSVIRPARDRDIDVASSAEIMQNRPCKWRPSEWHTVKECARRHDLQISQFVRAACRRHMELLDANALGPTPPVATPAVATVAPKPPPVTPTPRGRPKGDRKPRVPDKAGKRPLPLVRAKGKSAGDSRKRAAGDKPHGRRREHLPVLIV